MSSCSCLQVDNKYEDCGCLWFDWILVELFVYNRAENALIFGLCFPLLLPGRKHKTFSVLFHCLFFFYNSNYGIIAGIEDFDGTGEALKPKVPFISENSVLFVKKKTDEIFNEVHQLERLHGKRITCQYCKLHDVKAFCGRVIRSYHGCKLCGVALCRSAERNCFYDYHKEVVCKEMQGDLYISSVRLHWWKKQSNIRRWINFSMLMKHCLPWEMLYDINLSSAFGWECCFHVIWNLLIHTSLIYFSCVAYSLIYIECFAFEIFLLQFCLCLLKNHRLFITQNFDSL